MGSAGMRAQSLKAVTAARQFGVVLAALPADRQVGYWTMGEVEDAKAVPPPWLVTALEVGPFVVEVAARKLGVPKGVLKNAGFTGVMLQADVDVLAADPPTWLVKARAAVRRKGMARPKVKVTCPVCGGVRTVRASLVAGFDTLACSGHHASQAELGLVVPDGYGVWHEMGVAGYYDGFTVRPLTPRDEMSGWRAACVLAAAQGRPAPPAPEAADDNSWLDKNLMTVLTERLGEDGWEIADWTKEGRDYTVKVYTDWGWAGFLAGTARQIAEELEGQRDERAAAEAAGEFNCPTCQTRLHPVLGPTQCGCGTVAWSPASWVHGRSKIAGLMPYLEDAPDEGTLNDLVLVDVLACTHENSEWAWYQAGDTLETYTRLVPGARWSAIHDRLTAIVPTGTRFVPGVAGMLLDLARTCGYELVTDTSRNYDLEVTHGWFQREADQPVDGLPERFTIGVRGDGVINVVAGTEECWWPTNRERDFEDDALSELVDGVLDHFMATRSRTGWDFDTFRSWAEHDNGCAVVNDLPAFTVTVDSLHALLVEAGRQLVLAFQEADNVFERLAAQSDSTATGGSE